MASVVDSNENLKVVFDDGKEITLKRPNKVHLGQMLSATRKDPVGAADVVLNQLMIEGDKSIRQNVGYCHQLNKLIDDIFGKQACILEWNDGSAEVLFADDKKCILNPASRQIYAAAQAAAKINPIRFIEDILKRCWESGDHEIQQSPAHLLGFAEIIDEFVSYTGQALKN